MGDLFQPDPKNTTRMVARGWSRKEIEKILSDFCKDYEIQPADFVLSERQDGIFEIRFPNDIEPKHLCFLVNYAVYPVGIELGGRTIGVVAHTILTGGVAPPDPALIGAPAVVYVPANDTRFDEVFIKAGLAFRVSFTNLRWQSVDDPRLPASVVDLCAS
ncbi:MAG: hypothetical protein JSR60_10220 [Proteobacteria bacterium]|nr:hypothetical protein [Pseudomonadota bacterium]